MLVKIRYTNTKFITSTLIRFLKNIFIIKKIIICVKKDKKKLNIIYEHKELCLEDLSLSDEIFFINKIGIPK